MSVWHGPTMLRQLFPKHPSSCLHTLMSEDPLAIAKYAIHHHLLFTLLITCREAKALQQGLKDSLKNLDPWNKEVEFQRKK